jgi:hypothetical protein
MPRAKAVVRTVPAWGDRKVAGGAVGRATPVRPVHYTGQTGVGLDRQGAGFRARDESQFGSGGCGLGSWYGKSAGGQLLDVLPLVLNTAMGGVIALRWRGGTVHGLPFMVFVLLHLERIGSLIMVTMVVFIEVALIGDALDCANPTLEQMARHWFYSFGTNPVLSCLFNHVLTFEF